jgi:hypothetical protein
MKEKSIGALWLKQDKDYFTGSIEVNGVFTKIIVFKNNFKEKENQPDYKIYVQKELTEPKPVVKEVKEDPFAAFGDMVNIEHDDNFLD